VPRCLLQYPSSHLSLPVHVCINVIYPRQTLSHNETLHRVLMSACQGDGKGQAGDGGGGEGNWEGRTRVDAH